MSAKIYTVSDLIEMEQQYDAAWKAAKCKEELPEPPDFSGCEFDPRGLVTSLSEIDEKIPWLRDFLASGPRGRWRRYAVATFDLPTQVRRPATERFGRTLRFSHKELGDFHIDIYYSNSTIEFEFVSML